MRKAVVTGGAGFIGSHIVDALLEDGWHVEVIDDLSAGKRERLDPRAIFHKQDIRHLADIAPIMADADTIFHLAAIPSVVKSIEDPHFTHDVNVNGLLNVLTAARNANVRRVVYSASSAAYGENPELPHHEELLARPVHPYGLQKYIGEHYLRVWSELYGVSTVSLRYFNVYGPRMDPYGGYAAVIGRFLLQKKEGKPFTVTGDGMQTRDFVHVRDVACANLLAAMSPAVGRGESLNIGSGESISVRELAEMLDGPIEYIAARQEARHSRADNTKAKELLGWEPSIRIADGLRELHDMLNLRGA